MPVSAPLQVEIISNPEVDAGDYETALVPGRDGMRLEIRGLPDTLVHCVKLWDSSPRPVFLGSVTVLKVMRAGDTLSIAPLQLN